METSEQLSPRDRVLPAPIARLRGAVMRDAKDWIRQAYGEPLYLRALGKLSPSDRETIDGPILASTLYSVATWDSFLGHVRAEVKHLKGETEETFDRRNLQESGNRTVRRVYGFLLGFLHPMSVIRRVPSFFGRVYSTCSIEIVENVDGRAVLRLTAPIAFRENVRHHFPPSIELMIGLAKGTNIQVAITSDLAKAAHFVMEIAATYQR